LTKQQFLEFLKSLTKDGRLIYRQRVREMLLEDEVSLVIDFSDLRAYDPDLAQGVLENPKQSIAEASPAINDLLRLEGEEQLQEVHARFRTLPKTTQIRDIRARHIGTLLMVEGVATRVTDVKPELSEAIYRCERCGETISVIQTGDKIRTPALCENRSCASRGPFTLVGEQSGFIDWQGMRVQEKPESLRGGKMPVYINTVLRDDLVEGVQPGNRITVVGILKASQPTARGRTSGTVLEKFLEVNYVETQERGIEEIEITKEDMVEIERMSKDPLVCEKIIGEIAPSIWGFDPIKEAIALQLFSGKYRLLPDGTWQRGNINILLVGDPGAGKSALLTYTKNLAPRAVYASGRSSSAAGLTAAVLRDEMSGGFVLEAGALVLADGGIACLDEFEKMNEQDRAAIHEIMEQGTLSIAKAGIVATLNARTSVLAAANPKFGRFDSYRGLADQIELPPTILSRFDLIFPIRDVPKEDKDRMIAKHILKYRSMNEESLKQNIEPELLRKYISNARKSITPSIGEEAAARMEDFYADMRRGGTEGNPIPITPRQLESIVRLSEARARMNLRNEVTAEDVDRAIGLMEYCLRSVGVDPETGKIDIDKMMTGRFRSQWDRVAGLSDLIDELCQKHGGLAPIGEILEMAQEKGIDQKDANRLIGEMKRKGEVYEPKLGYLSSLRGS
jgi:replicative DNA helicase Mcm